MTARNLTSPGGVRLVGNGVRAFDGRLRVAFVIFGGMVALQSSQTLDATKFAYLAGTAVCLVGALAAIWSVRGSGLVRLGRPWIASSAALAGLIAISFLIARANETSATNWIRDVAAYALFAAVPFVALDGQAFSSRKFLVGLLLVAGILGGLSWAVEWLGRRDILQLPFARLVFPSGQLPGMLYLFSMATAMSSTRRRAAWVLLAGFILGLFLLTGTRSSLLLLIGPLTMAALAGLARIRSSLQAIAGHAVVAVAVVLAFQMAVALPVILGPEPTASEPGSSGSAVPSVPSVLGDRFGSLPGVFGNPSSDASFKERLAQYKAAWELFASSPIVGVGPGHSINWIDVSGYPRTGFTADTPLVMPAKFGLLGVFILLGAALAYFVTVRTALRRNRQSAITLTLIGYGVWTLVSLPLGFPVEDKGASLALMLLLGLAFGESAGDLPHGGATLEEPDTGRDGKPRPNE